MTDHVTGDSPSLVERSAATRGVASGVESVDPAGGEGGAWSGLAAQPSGAAQAPPRTPRSASEPGARTELLGVGEAGSAPFAPGGGARADAVGGDAVGGDAVGGDAVGGDAVGGDAVGGDAVGGVNSRLGLVALLASVVAIAWFLIVIARDVEAARFTRLDLRAVRVDSGPGWVDPRWGPALEQALAALPEMNADDPATLAVVRETLAALPFVAEVGEVRVLWPDGVRLQLRWREPVACVRTGDGFALVSSEGVVLPGEWSAPPGRAYGYYPLIGAGEMARAELETGAWLQDERWLDGLSVARVLAKGLQPDDWIRLGRIVIDTRESRAASVEHPGVVLWFEGGRRAYFGRAPHLDEPGELPVARKCLSLSLALRRLDDGPEQLDWELVDLRWDQPELLPRGGLPDATGVAR